MIARPEQITPDGSLAPQPTPLGLESRLDHSQEIGELPDEDICSGEGLNERGAKLVGSKDFELSKGRLVLPPDTVFKYGFGVDRKPILREPWMIGATGRSVLVDILMTTTRRFFGGERLYLDLYGPKDDALKGSTSISVSSDAVGSQLVEIPIYEPIIARKGVFFGSEEGVRFGITGPLFEIGRNRRGIGESLRRAAYGPGPILQSFSAVPGKEGSKVILGFDGDWEETTLGKGELSDAYDPRHVYAWDEGVSFELVPFGRRMDLLLRGELRYYIQFEGPGRLWTSNSGYSDGYWGKVCTPAHWVHSAMSTVTSLIGKLIP